MQLVEVELVVFLGMVLHSPLFNGSLCRRYRRWGVSVESRLWLSLYRHEELVGAGVLVKEHSSELVNRRMGHTTETLPARVIVSEARHPCDLCPLDPGIIMLDKSKDWTGWVAIAVRTGINQL